MALVDLVSTLSSGLTSEEILDSALLIVMGQLQCRRGCVLVRMEAGDATSCAPPAACPRARRARWRRTLSGQSGVLTRVSPQAAALLDAFQLDALCPLAKPGGAGARAIGLGRPHRGRSPSGGEEAEFLRRGGRLRGDAARERPHEPASCGS